MLCFCVLFFCGEKMKKVKENWYWILIGAVTLIEFITFIISGSKHTIIGVHDNLDIHITDYQILKQNNAFFSHGTSLPLLVGIDRNF